MSRKNELPDGWKRLPLRDIAEIYAGCVLGGAEPLLSVGDVKLWVSVGEVILGVRSGIPQNDGAKPPWNKRGVRWYSTSLAPQFSVGTVLLDIRSRILRRRIVLVPALTAEYRQIRAGKNHGIVVDPVYLAYWFAGATRSALTRSAVLPSMTIEELKESGVPIPPIDEQSQIVAGLHDRSKEDYRNEVAALTRAIECLDGHPGDSFNAVLQGKLTKPGWEGDPRKKAIEEVVRLFLGKWPDLLGGDGSQKCDLLSEVGIMFSTIRNTVESSEKRSAESDDHLARLLEQGFAGLRQTLERVIPSVQPQPKGDWPIDVNIERRSFAVKGETYGLEDDYDARILAALNEARGHPVSRSKMQQMDSLLAQDTHLERRIKQIPKKYPILKDVVRRYGDHNNAPFCLDVTKLA